MNCLLSFGLKAGTGPSEENEATPIPGLPDLAPDEFDRFHILEKIGEGGCGVVYRAEQLQPVRREVALKVIKLGLDTANVIARFEAERQALALMDHPGIAKVFDAGSSRSGRPFFVMELVAGERITDFCDQRQLSIAQRLELFTRVCEAVQHAHQKGIIHRDLKPSNILLTEHDGVAQPKVIDFGIAKATSRQRLADQTIYTAFDQFVGTPAYMSPEQAGATGEDVDTRSDIYSLGVLLYELLTGRPPFEPERLRQAAVDEIFHIIRDEDPARPSARLTTLSASEFSEIARRRFAAPPKLLRELRGDLDWVVMKALEKLPARRYETANALAAEIRRHLHHEPVLARPPGAAYRLTKFVRRNRVVTAAVAAVSLALIAGTVISAVLALRARRAETEQRRLREEAQIAAAEARVEADASGKIFAVIDDVFTTRRTENTQRRITRAYTDLSKALRQRGDNELKPKSALVGRILSLLVLSNYLPAYGEDEGAERLLREAVALAPQLGSEHDDIRAGLLECLAFRLYVMKRADEAEKLFQDVMTLREQSSRFDATALQASCAYGFLASRARDRGELTNAESRLQLHLEAVRKRNGTTNLAVAQAMWDYGKVFQARGDWTNAESIYRQTQALFQATLPKTNDSEFGELLFNLGTVQQKLGDHESAKHALRNALKVNRSWWTIQAALALAKLESASGNTNGAEQCYKEIVSGVDEERGVSPSVLRQTFESYASLCRARGDWTTFDALTLQMAKLCLRSDAVPQPSTIRLLQRSAEYQMTKGNVINAEERARLALAVAYYPKTPWPPTVITAHCSAAIIFAATGGDQESEQQVVLMVAAVTNAAGECISGRFQPIGALVESMGEVARHLGARSRHQEAEIQFRLALEIAGRMPQSNDEVWRTYDMFANYLMRQKRPEEAAGIRAEVKKLRAGQPPK